MEVKVENFKGLAIKGGGVAGVAYLGALRRWLASGLTFDQFDVFIGSSAGSMVAALLALRAPLSFLESTIRSTDFESFLDTSLLSKAENAVGLLKNYGWNSSEKLELWFADVIGRLSGDKELTLHQAYVKYGTRLMITTTDVLYPKCKLVVMDWKSHPNETLHSAVRKSCSIPLFFRAVFGSGADKDHIFVDGGVMDNYPLELLYDILPKEQCMGLYLTKPPKKSGADHIGRPVEKPSEFISSILNTWMDAMMGQHVSSDDWTRTCSIPARLSAIDFSASRNRQEEDIEQGDLAMEKFILSIRLLSRKPLEKIISEKDARIQALEADYRLVIAKLYNIIESINKRGYKPSS